MVVFLRSTFLPVVPRPLIISNAMIEPSYFWRVILPAKLFLGNGGLRFLSGGLAFRLSSACRRGVGIACAIPGGCACRDRRSNMHQLDAWRQDALLKRGFWPLALLPAT